MVRRMFAAIMLTVVGMLTMGGLASAAPETTPPSYPQTGPATLVATPGSVTVGSSVALIGHGYLPGESIGISLVYTGINPNVVTAGPTADPGGNFGASAEVDQVGLAIVTATGATSGKSASATIDVLANGSTVTVGTTTAVAVLGTSESLTVPTSPSSTSPLAGTSPSGTSAETSASSTELVVLGTSGSASPETTTANAIAVAAPSGSDGLAYTGASIEGPLLVGGAALVFGSILLFLGARLARKRRSPGAAR